MMEKFTRLTAAVACLPDRDIDTDIIFPARFLLITEKTGLGRYAFLDRRRKGGVDQADFPVQPGKSGILLAGANFGCGSSREQAVWALLDLGIGCIIAPSFGEIFQANCYRNGLLPITLPAASWSALQSARSLTVDLVAQQITAAGAEPIAFAVPAWRREALLNGWDEVLTLLRSQGDRITAFETVRRAKAPWLFAQE